MQVQVLASVMNQSMEHIAEKMKLSSDAVIINQCDCLKQEEMEYRGNRIRFFPSLKEVWEEAAMRPF